MIDKKLVLVEWLDSCGCTSSWAEISDDAPKALTCKSVGWLAGESEEAIVIVPHFAPLDDVDQGCGDMTIPRVCITKMTDLEVVTDATNASDS